MKPRVIALTGAESSGKTTLARRLAEDFSARLVNEASRDLLRPGEPYGLEDVLRIAREQVRREEAALAAGPGRVVLDTDLLVIRIWLDERFRVWPDELERLWQRQAPRLYVLTAPEMPWEPDPLRENPGDRERLHGRYIERLAALGCEWIEVRGSVGARALRVSEWLEP